MLTKLRNLMAIIIWHWLNKHGGKYYIWEHCLVVHTKEFYEWASDEGWKIFNRIFGEEDEQRPKEEFTMIVRCNNCGSYDVSHLDNGVWLCNVCDNTLEEM